MKKALKIILLIFNLLMPISIATTVIINGDEGGVSSDPLLVVLSLLGILSIPISWIIYIINVFRNTTVAKNQRAIWVFLLIFGHFVVSPFYWYFHIWKDEDNSKGEEVGSMTGIPLKSEELPSPEMSKRRKITLLVLSLLPVISMLTGIILMFCGFDISITYFFGWLFYISYPCLIIYYVLNIRKNSSVAQNQKALWIVLTIFGNIIIFPIYWYLHIWRSQNHTIEQQSA